MPELRAFYDRQVALLEAGDVETIVTEQYAEDAVLVSFDVTRRGRAELRDHFHGYLAQLGGLKVLSTDKYTETDDAVFFEATVQTGHGVAKVYDVFVLRDGQATQHFTGLISFTPSETGR
jgi:ketosteroid isomerase-like protein